MPMTDAEDEVVWQAASLLDYINQWRGITIVVGTSDTWVYDDTTNKVLASGATLVQVILALHEVYPNGRRGTND